VVGAVDDPAKAAFDRNQKWVKPGADGFTTALAPDDEAAYQGWVKKNNVPWRDSPTADYDMRGFWQTSQYPAQWQALQKTGKIPPDMAPFGTSVDPNDRLPHYPDYWKTPYHETFSNESQWATPDAPAWTNTTPNKPEGTDADRLVDQDGNILFDDRVPAGDYGDAGAQRQYMADGGTPDDGAPDDLMTPPPDLVAAPEAHADEPPTDLLTPPPDLMPAAAASSSEKPTATDAAATEKPSLLSEFTGPIYNTGREAVMGIHSLANRMQGAIADTTGIGADTAAANTAALAKMKADNPPMPSAAPPVTQIGSLDDAARWAFSVTGSVAGAVAQLATMGIPRAAALAAMEGFEETKEKTGSTASALESAGVQAAAQAVPLHLLGTAFKGTVPAIAGAAAGMAGTNVAAEAAQRAIEGDKPMTAADAADQVARGIAMGVIPGVAGHFMGRGTPTPGPDDIVQQAQVQGTKVPSPDEASQMAADQAAIRGQASPATSSPAPQPGDAIGLKFPKGPSQRATVDQYFDNGQSVRVRFDNGQVQDYLTADVLRDRVEPPPPMNEAPAPVVRPGTDVSQGESFDLMMEGERAAQAAQPQRQASTPTLGGAAVQALQQADALEFRAANDPSRTAEQRADDYAAAMNLRRRFGASTEAPAFSDDQLERAAQQRAAGPGTPMMGQNVPPIDLQPPQFTDEQLGRAAVIRQQAAVAAQQARDAAAAAAETKLKQDADNPPRRPADLLDFLSKSGGVRDDTGDLAAMDAGLWHTNQPFRRKLVNPDGLSLPMAFEKANEAGYGPYHDEAELLDAIRDNLGSTPHFSAADLTQAQRWEEAQQQQEPILDQLHARAHELGLDIPPNWTGPEILAEIHEREGMMADNGSAEALADRQEAEDDAWLRVAHPDLFSEIHDGRADQTAQQPEPAQGLAEGLHGPQPAAGGAGEHPAPAAIGPGGGQAAGAGADAQPQGVSRTTPEPASDIRAQISAMMDPATSKDAVFVAAENEDAIPYGLPRGIIAVARPEGILLTTNRAKAERFQASDLNDNDMAQLLGYPETKADAVASGQPVAIQGKDAAGNVVADAVASPQRAGETAAAIAAQVPEGGSVAPVSPVEAQQRRAALVEQEQVGMIPTSPAETVNEPAPELGTRHQPVRVETAEDLAHAERHVNTEPSEAQIEAGNYAKGHLKLHGLDITIENPKGSIRRGVGPDGKPWEVEMPAAYGYIRRTEGADGDHVDAYIGPDPRSDRVFLIDQHEPGGGKFDEHKVMAGFPDAASAFDTYHRAFSDGSGPERMGHVAEMSVDQFKDWLKRGDTTAPAREAVNPANPMELHEVKHTKTGADLFAVRLVDRVEGDHFKVLSQAAKKLGGYYSSFRGKGAVPGWQFKTREAAEQFMRDNGGGLAERPGAKVATPAEKIGRIADLQTERGAEARGDRVAGSPAQSFAAIEAAGRKPWEMSRQEFIDAHRDAFVRAEGAKQIAGVQSRDGSTMWPLRPGDQTSGGKLLRSPEEILGRIHDEGVAGHNAVVERGKLPNALPHERAAAEAAQREPPPWVTSTTPEGKRQLAVAAGFSPSQAVSLSKIGWPNLTPEEAARMTAQWRKGDIQARWEDERKAAIGSVGQNAAGRDLFEDDRGVRSYVLNGVRRTEPVGIVPGRGITIDPSRRGDEFSTTEERGAAAPAQGDLLNQAPRATSTEEEPHQIVAGPSADGSKGTEPTGKNAGEKIIQDAGEKIGGARKDRWAERGLALSDLDGMTGGEEAKYVTKDAVWPKPDYAALVENGMEPEAAALLKIIRDRLAAKPSKDTPQGRRDFVETMGNIKTAFESAKTAADIKSARDAVLYDKIGLPKDRYGRGAPEQRDKLFSVIKGRTENLWADNDDVRKAQAMVRQGFPGEPEQPWLKDHEIIEASGRATLRRNGKFVQSFPDKAAAEAYLKDRYDARRSGNGAAGKVPERPHLDNLDRSGPDNRNGRDVAGEDFVKDFGFRGVEFGNWVAGDERQKSVNLAYDALHDLAHAVGIPPEALSLDGKLSLAFGARGTGRAAAHYEPGKLVINMTKLSGAGSLAHEWGHALDHYFGEMGRPDAYEGAARGASGWYDQQDYSGKPRQRFDRATGKAITETRLAHLRPEMAQAFDTVMSTLFKRQKDRAEAVRDAELRLEEIKGGIEQQKQRVAASRARLDAADSGTTDKSHGKFAKDSAAWISEQERRLDVAQRRLADLRGDGPVSLPQVDSSYYENARRLSGKTGAQGYWARPTEMFARAFEAHVFDKMKETGTKSDYLVHGVEGDRYASDLYKGNPYPTAAERTAINAAFDELTKSIRVRPGESGNETMFQRAPAPAPGFYSALERGVEAAQQERAPAATWKGFIRNLAGKGVKQDEIEWSGVNDWLDTQKGVISKADVLEHLRQNDVGLQEVMKGPDSADEGGWTHVPARTTKFDEYTLPGGENYREMLLTLPESAALRSRRTVFNRYAPEIAKQQRLIDDPLLTREERAAARTEMDRVIAERDDKADRIAGSSPDFRSPHFEEPNVLAHIRMADHTDAEGKKTLLLEEVQSDWHQQGRRKGYVGAKPELPEGVEIRPVGREFGYFVDGRDTGLRAPTAQRAAEDYQSLHGGQEPAGGVPNAPFKSTWQELAMKRMLRYAAENGYDKLAWTRGETQADRYDLSKRVSEIWAKPVGGDRFEMTVTGHDGVPIYDTARTGAVRAAELENVVGKEMAQKIIDHAAANPSAPAEFSGLDLKVGGEGMQAFYDKMLPSFVNKYAKKWGAKVGESEINSGTRKYSGPEPTEDAIDKVDRWIEHREGDPMVNPLTGARQIFGVDNVSTRRAWDEVMHAHAVGGLDFAEALNRHGTPEITDIFGGKTMHEEPTTERVHSVDITPQMRDSVMGGQPLFQRGAEGDRAGEMTPVTRGLEGEARPSEAYTAHEAEIAGQFRGIVEKMFPGAEGRVFGKLRATAESGEAGQVFGAYHRDRAGDMMQHVIAGSLEMTDPKGTARHEGFHYVLRSGILRPEEDRVLDEAAERNGWVDAGIKRDYGHLPERQQLEEAKAEAYRKWAADRAGFAKSLPAPVQAIFQKIDLLMRRVAAMARQVLGKDATADDVFGRIESGEVGRRALEGQTETEPQVPWVTEQDLDKLQGAFGTGSPQFREALDAYDRQQPSSELTSNDYPRLNTLAGMHAAEAESTGREGIAMPPADAYEAAQAQQRLARPPANDRDAAALQRRPFEQSPEFRRWFAGSAIVDQDGRPKMVYHGTDAEDFQTFDRSDDIGFHFADQPEVADTRLQQMGAHDADAEGSPRVIPAYLSIKNPLRLSDLHTWDPRAVINELHDRGLLTDAEALGDHVVDREFVKDALDRHGYDGIVYKNETEGGGDSYIALDPRQIKSPYNDFKPGTAGDTAFQRVPRDEQPEVAPTGQDYLDDVSDQIAETVHGQGAGTYARRLARSLPDAGAPLGTKMLGTYEKFVIQPRTLAATDWRSARYWDAWRRKDTTMNGLRHDWADQSKSYVALSSAQRRQLAAVEEIDRVTGTVRPNDGRRVVARNERDAEAEFSKPGQMIALDPATTAAYHDRRALFGQVWHTMMEASAKRLGWDGPVDADAIREAAKKPMLPAGEAKRLNGIADLVQAMAAQEQTGYSPLMRFGDYYIAVKPKEGTEPDSLGGFPETKRFELVDSRAPFDTLFGKTIKEGDAVPAAAAKRIAELQAKYGPDFDIEHGYLARNAEALRKLDIPAIEKMFVALGQKDSELFGPMVEQLRDKMYEELKAGFKKRARTVPGYSTDWDRATGAYLGWTSGNAAEMLHGDEIRQAQEAYVDRHPDKAVQRYWQKWAEYQKDPAEEMQKLRQFGFYWALAGNPSSMALIATHGPMVAHATLGAGGGFVEAGRHLYGALGEAIKHIGFDTEHGLHINLDALGKTPAEKALLAQMVKGGQLHEAASDDIRGLGQNTMESLEPVRQTWKKMLNIAASTVGVTDQMNRAGVALASYRLAQDPAQLARIAKTWGGNEIFREMTKRDGLNPETVAKFMVDEGLFVWGKHNRAPIQRGTAGTMLFQFRNFEANYLGTLWKMMHRMGPEGKGAAVFMLGGLGVLGGAMGLPFSQDLENAGDALGKVVTGIDPQIGAKLASLLEDSGFSQMGAEMLLRGPSRAALGIDLTSRLGMGEAATRNLTPTEALGVVPSMLYGRLSAAWNRLNHAQPLGATAELLPSAARNLMRGTMVYPNEGVRTVAKGNVVVPPNKITTGERVAQSLGFEPANVARAYEEREYGYRTANAGQERHSRVLSQATELISQAADAQKAGDANGAQAAKDSLAALLKANPDQHITPKAIEAQIMARENAQAAALKHAPKGAKAAIMGSPFVPPQ
jgi:hypothetical protein